jgi:hypothetical protein
MGEQTLTSYRASSLMSLAEEAYASVENLITPLFIKMAWYLLMNRL